MKENKLTRHEKIKLEAGKALEYHQQVFDIPLHENFRVEAASQDPYHATLLENSFLHGGNKFGVLVVKNPYLELKSEKSLVECLNGDLELLERRPDQETKDRILNSYQQLTNHYGSNRITKQVKESILQAIFGAAFFENSNEFKIQNLK